MSRLSVRFVVGSLLCCAALAWSFVQVVHGAHHGPASLDQGSLDKTSQTIVHNNATIWHVNGEPVYTQRSVGTQLISEDFLSYPTQQNHHAKTARGTKRYAEAEQQDVQNSARHGLDTVLTAKLVTNHAVTPKYSPFFSHLIDPKKMFLGLQSRWGVRIEARHRSRVVRMIHTILIKEETIA